MFDNLKTLIIEGKTVAFLSINGKTAWKSSPDEPITIKLATPVIALIEETESEPDEPQFIKLATPIISLYEEIESEPEEPDIPDEPITVKLATPEIKLIDVTDNAVKMTFDNYGYIDFTGTIVSSNMGGKGYSDIVAISDLANGPDGHCVQDFDLSYNEYPKVLFFSDTSISSFISGFTVEEIGNKDVLTAAEIKSLAESVPGAMYVAFNSDYEEEQAEDCVYIVKDALTFKPIVTEKLATPVIELVEIEDGGEVKPEEPEVPETPITTKLATPYIELVVVEDTGGEDSDDDSGGGAGAGSGGVTPPTPGGDATEDQM